MDHSRSNKITIKGSVHIGEEMKLIEKLVPLDSEDTFFRGGRPAGLSPVYDIQMKNASDDIPAQSFVQELQSTHRQLAIMDDGLVASYGIFGSSGSGKTHLLLYLLDQILNLNKNDENCKFGALILDPKPELVDQVKYLVTQAGRDNDLIVINTDELRNKRQSVNIINAALEPHELGLALVQAAMSAGVATSDPYWMLSWGNLFAQACYILKHSIDQEVTIQNLMDAVLMVEQYGERTLRPIEKLAQEIEASLSDFESAVIRRNLTVMINGMRKSFSQKDENMATIENILFRAYYPFMLGEYECYSARVRVGEDLVPRSLCLYDSIMEDGKIVLVSLSSNEPNVARTLCTLIKCLFQRSVMSRTERLRPDISRYRLYNRSRPVVMVCDEYSKVASEIPGVTGDADFFSVARSMGCMGLIATQNVNMLQSSSLKENWRAIFSIFGAKIFMRLLDSETVEEAAKLAGESEFIVTSRSTSESKDGVSFSNQGNLQQRKNLPTSVLTQVFQKGDAVLLGSLDGSATKSQMRYFHVPKDFKITASRYGG